MRRRNLIAAGAVLAMAAAFLLFRPDKLFVDDSVDEALAEAFATETTMAAPPGTAPVTTDSTAPSVPVTTAPPSSVPPSSVPPSSLPPPEALARGDFFGIDHTAMGTATVYEQGGRYVLRFEDDTDIQNGPDLFVWLTSDTDWDAPGAYLDLGKLKGNVGGQNYELPPEFDPAVHRNVLIWCLRFAVPFAAVEMAGA